MIDPGHGGQDSGAIGVNGIYEKDVNLDISLRLKELLLAAGYQVILTREDDHALRSYKTNEEKRADLQARVDVATHVEADLFVSIHANYYKSNSQGTLVLYYDPSNSSPNYQATDQMKKWSAESKKLAITVLNSITSTLGLNNLGVEPSNVYVVRSGTVPSILVETAFLSNKEEAAKLADSVFRQAMAQSIANGILSYLPPRFIDVRDHWAKTEISMLSYQGIINGYSDRLFKPDQQMTRVEWITLLDKTLGLEEEPGAVIEKQFKDISPDYWAYDAIMNAIQRGIVTGFSDGTFKPNQSMSREEMAVTLYRALYSSKEEEASDIAPANEEVDGNEGVEIEDVEIDSQEKQGIGTTAVISSYDGTSDQQSAFVDIPSDHWSSEAIIILNATGLIKGINDNMFGLGKIVTRAEAATIIYRILNQ